MKNYFEALVRANFRFGRMCGELTNYPHITFRKEEELCLTTNLKRCSCM